MAFSRPGAVYPYVVEFRTTAGSPFDEEDCDDRTTSPTVAPHASAPARSVGLGARRRLDPGGGLAEHTVPCGCARVPGAGCSQVRQGVAKSFLAVPSQAIQQMLQSFGRCGSHPAAGSRAPI
jgi:hypothetical protein